MAELCRIKAVGTEEKNVHLESESNADQSPNGGGLVGRVCFERLDSKSQTLNEIRVKVLGLGPRQ